MAFLSDLWTFLKTRKKFWLLPLGLILLISLLLLVLSMSGGSDIEPFTYTVF